uniref:Uncharacterized protein n=1 Tax=Kalanchoe fedtschenkoi TaxID=63787 RepID=A0A7N0UZH5_KALFE
MDKSVDIVASDVVSVQEILVKASVVKKCVELGYSAGLVDVNMILNSTDWFTELVASTPNIFVGKSQLFFVRGSSSTRTIWDNSSINQVVATTNSLASKASGSTHT